MRKEEYEGQFEAELEFCESEKKELQERLEELTSPDYKWQDEVDEYERHLQDIEDCEAEIREVEREIRKIKRAQQSVHLTGGTVPLSSIDQRPEANPAIGENQRPATSR